ncbi:MAG: tetratricopeptide repeat protein [Flavobacteriales bacterium]|nr:tetratricopeptide repeat protein [Flavobacteriales bacterium]
MKKLFPIFLIVILSLSKDWQCVAQNFSLEEQHQIDSLNTIINNPNNHDTTKAICYIQIASIYSLEEIDTAIFLCEKAEKLSENANFIKGKSHSYGWLGYFNVLKGNTTKALEYFHKSLKLDKETGNKQEMATKYDNIGAIYYYQGDIPKALQCYNKSLKLSEELGDKSGMSRSYNNIGEIYRNQEDVSKGMEYHQKSLKLRLEVGDKKGIATSYINIGNIYNEQGNSSKGLHYYYKSLELNEELNDKLGIANSYNNIGNIYDKQGSFSKGLEYHNKSLKLKEEIGHKQGVAQSYNSIGQIKFKLGVLDEAKGYGTKGLKLAQELGFPRQISQNSKLLSEVAQEQGNYQEALEMYKLHITMRDSLNNEETQKAAAKQQAKYEYEKQKAIDDKEHEKQLAIEQEAKEKQQVITYATAGGLGLVGIFLIFVFNRLQVTKRQKNIIEEQKQAVEEQKQIVETAHHELEEKNQEILDSINYAKRIQNAILPPQKVVKEFLQESFILYKPKDIVAGDFYWLEHKENKVLFAACDCTGHGVPGAMVSVVCNNGLNRSVREYNLTDPGKILDKTREIVIQEFEKSEEEVKDGMDIALCSLQGNTLHYAGANNPLWIIRKGAEEIEEIKADKQPIGKYAEPTPYTTHKIELQKGDTIYIFSDGYADQFGGEKGKKFKAANFKKLLLSIQNETIEQQRELINQAFEEWKGDLEQLDDVCVIGVKI